MARHITRRAWSRREFVTLLGAAAAGVKLSTALSAESAPAGGETAGNNIEFDKTLKRMRLDYYGHPPVDILK